MGGKFYKEMTNQILIDLDNKKEETLGIVSSLKDDAILEAYYLLKNLNNPKSKSKDIEIITKVQKNNVSFETVMQKYLEYLKACSKAELTIKKYTSEISKFLNYLKENCIDFMDLNLGHINNYLSKTKSKRKLVVNSYSKVVINIRSFLKFLCENEIMDTDFSNKIIIPKTVTKEMDFLNDSDIEKVEQYLINRKENYIGENLRDKIVFYLGLYCGLRKSEIINLDWNNVIFNQDILKILNSKGGKDRKVKFGNKLKNILTEYRKTSDKYIGAAVRGNFRKRMSQCSLQKIITRIFKESNIYRKGLTLHSLRHTYAVKQIQKGTDIHTLKNLMGHSSIVTTEKYLHLLDENIDNSALE